MTSNPDLQTALEAGTVVRGRYRLFDPTSATGQTIRAFDRIRQQTVALRLYGPLVPEPIRQHVRRRAAAAANVTHPLVAPLFAFDEAGEWALAVRAWVEGEPLATYLARRGALTPAALRRLALSLFEGVLALDAAGLAHGHLTPRNVILVSDDEGDWSDAILVDAGLSPLPPPAGQATDRAALARLLVQALGGSDPTAVGDDRAPLGGAAGVRTLLRELERNEQVSLAEARVRILSAIAAWEHGTVAITLPTAPASAGPPASADQQAAAREAAPAPESALSEPAAPLAAPALEAALSEPAAPLAAPPSEAALSEPAAPLAAPALEAALSEPAAPLAAPPPEVPPALPRPREVRITGTPPGAQVLWDDQPAGTTPLIVRDHVGGRHGVVVAAPGYLPQRFILQAEGDLTLEYTLTPAPLPPDEAAAPATLVPADQAASFGEPTQRPRWWRRWQAWALLGTGGVVLVLGVVLGVTPLQLFGLMTILGAAGAMIAG
ncbi:MAG: PEGA domain-containing protein [Chloroflexi bacterium]|nr:PEGA domain-containing protein [Chloroflexota bacterium]